jgi:hypothetical protein
MALIDDYADKDNTRTMSAGNTDTGEMIIFSRFDGYMLFEGVVNDPKLRVEIEDAIRTAEQRSYNEALRAAQQKLGLSFI